MDVAKITKFEEVVDEALRLEQKRMLRKAAESRLNQGKRKPSYSFSRDGKEFPSEQEDAVKKVTIKRGEIDNEMYYRPEKDFYQDRERDRDRVSDRDRNPDREPRRWRSPAASDGTVIKAL